MAAQYDETTRAPTISEIEDEIRRQMRAERQAAAPQPPAPQAPGQVPAPDPYYVQPPPARQSALHRQQARGGIVGAIATLLLVLAKIGAPVIAVLAKLKFLLVGLKALAFVKLLLAGGSMFVSMWVWGLYFGWPFGVGLVLLIFVHECGHALAARLRGIPTGIMVFIPLMGAFVTTKRYGQNVAEDAFIGIMGPVFGTLGGLVCVLIYLASPSPFWLVLAQWNFAINLFNLAPTPPLDGGWITPLFSPKLLAVGAVLLLFVALYNPLILILALMSLPRIIAGWKAKPDDSPYYQASSATRWKFGIAYLGLALFLALAQYGLHSLLVARHPIIA